MIMLSLPIWSKMVKSVRINYTCVPAMLRNYAFKIMAVWERGRGRALRWLCLPKSHCDAEEHVGMGAKQRRRAWRRAVRLHDHDIALG